MIRLRCPACNARIAAPEKAAGKESDCPKCGRRLRIPKSIPALLAVPDEDYDQEDEAEADDNKPKKASPGGKICAILSFVFGGLSLILCAPFFGCIGVAPLFGLVGLTLGIVSLALSKDKVPAILATVLSVIGLACGMLVWVAFLHSR